ncbi:MAG: hypothetical protein QM734_16030 [Cyclobacteriaceae bacterium]
MKSLKIKFTILLSYLWFTAYSQAQTDTGQDFVFVKYLGDQNYFHLYDLNQINEFKKNAWVINASTEKSNEVIVRGSCSDLQRLSILVNIKPLPIDEKTITITWNSQVKTLSQIDDIELKKSIEETVKNKDKHPIEFVNISKLISQAFPEIQSNPGDWYNGGKASSNSISRICQLATMGEIKFKLGNLTVRIQLSQPNQEFPNIEPRQYVTIYEKKNAVLSKDGSLVVDSGEPIWWLVKDKDPIKKDLVSPSPSPRYQFYPNQKHKVISSESVLEIRFDNEALANNIDFHGSVSLMAKSGETKIEVSPYSVIGQDQKDFGVDAMPIKEIADYFLRLMIESARLGKGGEVARGILKEINDDAAAQKDEAKKRQTIQATLTSAQTFTTKILATIKSPTDTLANYQDGDLLLESYRNLAAYLPSELTLKSIINQMGMNISSIRKLHGVFTFKSVDDYIKTITIPAQIPPNSVGALRKQRLSPHISTAKLCFELMKHINESNDQSINAFLSFTTLTVTDFNDLFSDALKLSSRFDADTMKIENSANTIIEFDQIFSRFKGSSILFSELTSQRGYDFSNNNSIEDQIKSFLRDQSSYNYIRDEFAKEAGKEIFKKMVYATIDLSKANLPEGSQLDIAVVWYNAEGNIIQDKNSMTSNGTELWTASFIVKKTGWHFDVTESALLIQRIGEDKLRGGNYPLSPSDFKPTAGASMMWSFYNTFRTKTRIKSGVEKEYGFVKFIHWLEPSFGLNVSYLDFRTDVNFEVGAAPIIGLFQNRLFFMPIGYNFSVENQSPWYMGVGFSFSKVYDKIHDNAVNK